MNAPTPFQCQSETGRLLPVDSQQPAALQINPQASLTALVAAAESRMDLLLSSLRGWALSDPDHPATPAEIVMPAAFLAEQALLLIEEVGKRLDPAGGAS